jgi:hypothetical protein
MHRFRNHLLAIAVGLGLIGATPGAIAAENLVFMSGAFRRSIPVADMEHLAATGEARGLLGDVLNLSGQDPDEAARLLNASVSLPIPLVSRLMATRIGEALLIRLARVIHPLKAYEVGLPAMRSAVIMGLVDGNGSLSAIRFLKAYPNDEMGVNLPALMALVRQVSSISDLVRFFSESPLDGLRGDGDAAGRQPSAGDAARTPGPAEGAGTTSPDPPVEGAIHQP